jgi:hypothetical protein
MDYFRPDPKVYSKKKEKSRMQRSSIKQKVREPTGELELFKRIFKKRGGKCCITDEVLQFHVECFAHVLSKGAFPSFRLEEYNIVLVQRKIHRMYDNGSKEDLLAEFPRAAILYELKDALKEKYQLYSMNKKFHKTPKP